MIDHNWPWLVMVDHDSYYKPNLIINISNLYYKIRGKHKHKVLILKPKGLWNQGSNIKNKRLVNQNINIANTKINMVYFDGETIIITMWHSTTVDYGWLWLEMVYHHWYFKPKWIVNPRDWYYKPKGIINPRD